MISKSLDELFIKRLREIISEQKRHIDSLVFDCDLNSKLISKLISEIELLNKENKKNLEEINTENYFLEKFNDHLELEIKDFTSKYGVQNDKKKE